MFRVFLFCMVCWPVFAGSGETCPWLNGATAGGLLGGPVTSVQVTHPAAADDATCNFVRNDGSQLRIEVETMTAPATEFGTYLARCHSPLTPLKAIGNEAVACKDDKPGETSEQVIGRVRKRAFVVRIGTSSRGAHPDALRDKLRQAAEQVAGILF